MGNSYKKAGISYDDMDPVKKHAQQAGRETANALAGVSFSEVAESRGESAYVVDAGEFYLAFVQECLGTKTLVAQAMRPITGKTYFDSLAQDTIAMMVNDILTVGAKPMVLMAYWAMGSSAMFADKQQMHDLIEGWKKASIVSGASWGGGESPTLKGVLLPEGIDLAGSCTGIINPKSRLTLGNTLQEGDEIVLVESSGIHANGISLARSVAETLPQGYETKTADGRMFGEAILTPTHIYSPIIDSIYSAEIPIHYMANITGHGWRKIMRNIRDFTYRIHTILPVPAELKTIIDHTEMSMEEGYGTFNMGAGFAIMVPQGMGDKTAEIISEQGLKAVNAGLVEKGQKQVIIEPLSISFDGDSLGVR